MVPWGYFRTTAKFGLLVKRASCAGVREVVVRLMTHLLLVDDVVSTGAVVVEAVVVSVGTVGVVGAVVTLLVTLFSCVDIVGVSNEKFVSTKVPKLRL